MMKYGADFDRMMWDRSKAAHTRTLDHLGGWHNALNRKEGRYHPKVYQCIPEIQYQHPSGDPKQLQVKE